MPLLRRAAVRETLKEGSFREAVNRRLRSSRDAYEELVQILSLVGVAASSALSVALLARETTFRWPLIALVPFMLCN